MSGKNLTIDRLIAGLNKYKEDRNAEALGGDEIGIILSRMVSDLEVIQRFRDRHKSPGEKIPIYDHVLSLTAYKDRNDQFSFTYEWELCYTQKVRRACLFSLFHNLNDDKLTQVDGGDKIIDFLEKDQRIRLAKVILKEQSDE